MKGYMKKTIWFWIFPKFHNFLLYCLLFTCSLDTGDGGIIITSLGFEAWNQKINKIELFELKKLTIMIWQYFWSKNNSVFFIPVKMLILFFLVLGNYLRICYSTKTFQSWIRGLKILKIVELRMLQNVSKWVEIHRV